MKFIKILLFCLVPLIGYSQNQNGLKTISKKIKMSNKIEIATFGAGCFWCVEAIFEQLDGVKTVLNGYMGGKTKNPTYKEVCEGNSGYVEVVQIEYDPTIISYKELLEIFWQTHDPTSKNRQGNDVGEQYRSVVFYHNDKQKKEGEFYKKQLNEQKVFNNNVVTSIEPATYFFEAENYHQNYFQQNQQNPYCSIVILPKVEKFKKAFKDKLK